MANALELIAKEKKEKTGRLELGNCGLTKIPKEVFQLKWLKVLILSNYWWDEKKWQWITSENIGEKNNLLSIPKEITRLNNLENLVLSGNSGNNWRIQIIENLPESLLYLDLNYNNIRKLENLSKKLNILRIWGNKIKIIENIPISLKQLYISFNEIIEFEVPAQLLELTTLDIRSNPINDLSYLSFFRELKYFYCDINELSNTQLFENQNQLNLLGLGIKQNPDLSFFKNFRNLNTLDLRGNNLTDIKFLSAIKTLSTLYLNNNQIIEANSLANLSLLTRLYLNNNQIKDISFLEKLKNLQILNLSNNKINDISILGKLTKLQTLNISSNQISDLTPLRYLIKDKRLEIGWETHYSVLFKDTKINIYIENNPLTTPPLRIIKKGRAAVLRYFEDIEKTGTDYLFEAKLLIVGEPGAGKTSLYRKLVDEKAALPKKDETTRGIDIHEYHFKTIQNKDFRINLWDFGGQVIMYFAHQFFLTENSLYVLVTDGRQENSNFKYWLQVIDMLGKESKVILVQNEVAGRVHKTNLEDYCSRFKNIVFTKSLNLDIDIPGIISLRKDVQRVIQKIPSIGKPLPKRWIQVREKLKSAAKKDDIIDCSRYFEICKKEDITDTTKALELSEDLHSLGVFLHFQKDPVLRNTIILNNSWATSAVYSLVDCEWIKNENKGQFTETEFGKIWTGARFNDRHFEIIQLLKNFNIIYEIPDSRIKKYIIPQLLTEKSPTYKWDETKNINLFFKYEFMPKGIISSFVVRMHRYIYKQKFVWRYGVILERENTMAEITENELDQSINIRIRGDYPQDFMTIIIEEIDKINSKFQDIKVEKNVPCNCLVCKEGINQTYYKYSDLKERLRTNTPKSLNIQCKNIGYDFIDVKSLIESIMTLDEKCRRNRDQSAVPHPAPCGPWPAVRPGRTRKPLHVPKDSGCRPTAPPDRTKTALHAQESRLPR